MKWKTVLGIMLTLLLTVLFTLFRPSITESLPVARAQSQTLAAESTLNDLCIESIRIHPNPIPSFRIYVDLRRYCLPIVIDIRLIVILNDLTTIYDSLVPELADPSSLISVDIGIQNLYQGDNITAVIDYLDVLPELTERNNVLSLILDWDSNYPPRTITTSYGTLVLDSEYHNTTRTGWFPFIVLRLPPFERNHCVGLAQMETSYYQEISKSETDEYSTSITAGLAVEATAGIPNVAEASIGVSIETSYEQARAHSSYRAWSEGHQWSVYAHDLQADDGIVMIQTEYEAYRYHWDSGSSYTGKLWIGAPQYNPDQQLCSLSSYNDHYKDDEAPNIDFGIYGHVGDLDSYPDYRYSPAGASTLYTLFDYTRDTNNRLRPPIGSGSRPWGFTLKDSTSITETVSVSVNFYASGTVAGVTVQSSFGAAAGYSHTTETGFQSQYKGAVGGVLHMDYVYYFMPFGKLMRDGYVVIAYYWKEVVAGVGGIWIPVDKFALLAPYIGLASTIVVATVGAAIYVKRVKRRKEK